MDFHNLILNRRSIRKYKSQEIPADKVKLILESALVSPSSKGKTPWQFVVVDDKEMLSQLSKCKDFGTKPLETAPIAVVITADPLVSDAWVEDASIAATFLQLQAEDFGLGSCWIQVKDRFREDGTPSEDFVKSLLNIPPDIRILCIVTIGYKDEIRKPYDPDKCKWEKVHIGTWRTED